MALADGAAPVDTAVTRAPTRATPKEATRRLVIMVYDAASA
jgi:hypothetical protein